MKAQLKQQFGRLRGRAPHAFACAALLLAALAAAPRIAAQQAPGPSAASTEGGRPAGAATTLRATVAVAPAAAPKVGDVAPDFRLPYATQEKIFYAPEEQMALSSLRGRNVVLAFYPADWSGGCTKEVCTLRDTFAELSKLNATVLGLSGDYVFSHHEWAKFHKLQFPLLADHLHTVGRLYGVYDEASGYNKRTIFLVDKQGVVRYTNLAFKAGDAKDYAALRAELEKLK